MKLNMLQIPAIKPIERPFFMSLIIYQVYMILSVSFYLQYINAVWKPVYILCIVLLCYYELEKNGMNLRNILCVGTILLLFINITRVGQGMAQNAVASVMFFMFCARDIPFRKIAWYSVLITAVMLAFVVFSAYAGIIRNYVAIAKGQRRREFLGFLYALNASTLMSNITLLWIWLKREKITVTGAGIFAVLNFLLYRKTDSRLCFFLTMAMLVFALFLRKHERFVMRRMVLCWIMVFAFLIACGVSWWLTVNYDPSVGWMKSLNTTFGNRLNLGLRSLKQLGVKPFGITGIKWVGNGLNMYGETSKDAYLYVDCYYIQIAQRFGYVFLAVILAVMTFAAWRVYRQKDIYLLGILALIAAHFMIDNLYMYLQYNAFWLAAGAMVFYGKRQYSVQKSEFRMRRVINEMGINGLMT